AADAHDQRVRAAETRGFLIRGNGGDADDRSPLWGRGPGGQTRAGGGIRNNRPSTARVFGPQSKAARPARGLGRGGAGTADRVREPGKSAARPLGAAGTRDGDSYGAGR